MSTVGLSDEEYEDLEYTRARRMAIISTVSKSGDKMTEDEMKVVLTACNDMDRTTVAKARVRASNKQADSEAGAANAILHLLNQVGSNHGVQSVIDPGPLDTSIINIPESVAQIEIRPGEDDIDNTNIDYESFQEKLKITK